MAQTAKRKRGRPPAAQGPDSRRLLLDAAERVFAQRGYGATAVDRVIAEAGLSKGTFYWHFGSKEELFLALIEERIDAPARELMDVTRSAPADAATAPVVSRGLAALLRERRTLVLLVHEYWSAAVRDPRIRRRYRRRQRRLRRGLADALEARHARTGVLLTIPADALATAFIALAEGLSMEALVDADAVPEGLYGEILSLVYDGLAVRAGG